MVCYKGPSESFIFLKVLDYFLFVKMVQFIIVIQFVLWISFYFAVVFFVLFLLLHNSFCVFPFCPFLCSCLYRIRTLFSKARSKSNSAAFYIVLLRICPSGTWECRQPLLKSPPIAGGAPLRRINLLNIVSLYTKTFVILQCNVVSQCTNSF